MRRAGFVLVGGKSSRMGRDKALLPFHGTTLVEHVAEQVRRAAGSVTLVGAPERYHRLGLPVIADRTEGCGPLAGIQAALECTEADWNLVVACDMPSVTADFLATLFEQAECCGGCCLLPVPPSGLPEPLCAVYHRDCLATVTRALQARVLKITDALAGAPAHYLLTLKGAGHLSFTDFCLPAFHGCREGDMTASEAQTLINRYGVAFLLRYVAGDGRYSSYLDGTSPAAPDATLERAP